MKIQIQRLFGRPASLLFLCLIAFSSVPAAAQSSIPAWKRWETSFTSTVPFANAYRDVELQITFTHSLSGQTFKTFAFWAGGQTFKARAAFPATGTWNWSTVCLTGTCNSGLAPKSGSVSVTSSSSDPNLLYAWGHPKATNPKHYLSYANNRGFFWVGDTAWTAPMRANATEWNAYLNDRQAKGFTVIQVAGSAFWMTNPLQDRSGNAPFQGTTTTTWNPAFWDGLAAKVQAANDKGMVVVFAGLISQSAVYSASKPAPEVLYPSLTDAKAFTRNLVGLLHGNAVVFSPGFDTDPKVQGSVNVGQRLKDVGAEVRRSTSRHLITTHWATINTSDILAFQGESWLDFQLFQSGAGWGGSTDAAVLDNITLRARQMALDLYNATPKKPAVNGEAVYDGPYSQPLTGANSNRFRVRQTAYLSSFSGARYYTYGAQGVWDWGLSGTTYSAGMAKASSGDMSRLFDLMTYPSVTWAPEHWRILNQPASNTLKMALVQEDLSTYPAGFPVPLGVYLFAYLPDNATIDLNLSGLTLTYAVYRWYDPTTGAYQNTTPTSLGGTNYRFTRPSTVHSDGTRDWVLQIHWSAYWNS